MKKKQMNQFCFGSAVSLFIVTAANATPLQSVSITGSIFENYNGNSYSSFSYNATYDVDISNAVQSTSSHGTTLYTFSGGDYQSSACIDGTCYSASSVEFEIEDNITDNWADMGFAAANGTELDLIGFNLEVPDGAGSYVGFWGGLLYDSDLFDGTDLTSMSIGLDYLFGGLTYATYVNGPTEWYWTDQAFFHVDDVNVGNPVPEPASMLLFGTGVAGLAGLRKRKKK